MEWKRVLGIGSAVGFIGVVALVMGLSFADNDKHEELCIPGVAGARALFACSDEAGLAFARPLVAGIYSRGSVLGMRVQEMTNQLRDYFGVQSGTGILISQITEDSPAERSGLLAGDVLTEINGMEIESTSDLFDAIREVESGDTLDLGVLRNGSRTSVAITVEEGDLNIYHEIFKWRDSKGKDCDPSKSLAGLLALSERHLDTTKIHDQLRETLKTQEGALARLKRGRGLALHDKADLSEELEALRNEIEKLRGEIEELRQSR